MIRIFGPINVFESTALPITAIALLEKFANHHRVVQNSKLRFIIKPNEKTTNYNERLVRWSTKYDFCFDRTVTVKCQRRRHYFFSRQVFASLGLGHLSWLVASPHLGDTAGRVEWRRRNP